MVLRILLSGLQYGQRCLMDSNIQQRKMKERFDKLAPIVIAQLFDMGYDPGAKAIKKITVQKLKSVEILYQLNPVQTPDGKFNVRNVATEVVNFVVIQTGLMKEKD